jgi:hypothetical protein
MATSVATAPLSELHMLVLVALAANGCADAERSPVGSGYRSLLSKTLCDELEAAGQLTLARGH